MGPDAVDERLRILRMVETGKITAAEAARLLDALDAAAGRAAGAGGAAAGAFAGDEGGEGEPARFVRVRIHDMHTGRPRLNLNVPFELLGLVVDMVERFAGQAQTGPDGISVSHILAELRAGVRGKVVDIEDEDRAVRLEVFVE